MKLELGFKGYGQAEITAAMACLASGDLTMGKRVAAFERQFAEFVDRKYAIMVNSGSSANLLAVAALSETDAQLPQTLRAPALTWATTISPLLQYGFPVRLVDCHERTLQAVEVTDVAAHVLGNGSDGNPWIADCCEALGVKVNGHDVSEQGWMATFSFYFSHHMTTIEGGMVVTDDNELNDHCRSIRSHGWTRGTSQEGISQDGIDPRFLFVRQGYNLRPMEINAAFGQYQLPKVPGWNAHRRQVYAEMRRRLEPLRLFDFVDAAPGCEPAWFCFPVLVRDGRRALLSAHLEAAGIQTRPIIAGNLARHPAFKDHPLVSHGPLPNADRVMEHGLYWGCHPGVDDAQIDYLVQTVEAFAEKREAA